MEEQMMREAIRLALENVELGRGGPFGAVLVKDGEIIGAGTNRVVADNDPTAHAEVIAIRAACQRLDTFQLDDCELYVTCEPCPMCLCAAYWARIPALYYACTRSDAQHYGFDDERFYREMCRGPHEREIRTTQMLRDEALRVFRLWEEDPDKMPY